MSQWTSEYAILRDLSVAQGRVPVAIEGTVGAGDKPPSLNITEETEEEYFKHCSADADSSAAPDLGLIKQMLDMVRDVNVSSDEEDFSDNKIVISKLYPKIKPKINNTSTPTCQSPKEEVKKDKIKKKCQRNIAVESILQAISDKEKNGNIVVTPEPMKLLKPNDFIFKNDITPYNIIAEETKSVQIQNDQSELVKNNVIKDIKETSKDDVSPTVIEKVNGWFNTQTESPFPKKAPKVTLEATKMTSMFKRKTVVEKVKKVETVRSPTSCSSGEFKPSRLANEYYQKYVERSKLKESVTSDIWTRAEKKMKEIDEKRRRELCQALSSPSTASQGSESGNQSTEEAQSIKDNVTIPVTPFTTSAKSEKCLDLIILPQHRHRLTGECVVCQVMTKKPSEPDDKKTEDLISTEDNVPVEDVLLI